MIALIKTNFQNRNESPVIKWHTNTLGNGQQSREATYESTIAIRCNLLDTLYFAILDSEA